MKTFAIAVATTLLLFAGSPEKHREIEKRYATQPSQRIEIKGFMGSEITFRSWEKNEVYIKLDISISASDDSYEVNYIDGVSVTDKQSAEALVVTFREPDGSWRKSFWSGFKSFFSGWRVRKEISGEIYLPQSNAFTTDMKYGSIALENMKGPLRLLGTSNTLSLKNCSSVQEIENNYGKTTLEKCGGSLDLLGESSKITVEDFNGNGTIDANYSTITVRGVARPLTINSQSATIKVDDLQSSLNVHSDYSTITANKIAGMVDIRTSSGKVRVKEAEGLGLDADYSTVEASSISGKASKGIYVKGQSGKLTLEDAVGDLKIENPYSQIDLRRIKGSVELSTESGRVIAEDISGDWNSTSQYSTVIVRSLVGQRVVITNSSNPVEVQLKSVPTHIDIKNQYGSASVSMPTGYAGEVSLEATYGQIECNLPIKVKSLGGGAYGTGKMGAGTGSINIETESGNIKLMQR
jgi:DUF4097 and DUF4098 domain-containing protein YvlB